MDKHWSRWDEFCVAHNVDPYRKTWKDPVPMLQVFGERYRYGCLTPHHKIIKARTVEDGIRAVVRAHARLGGGGPA
jgi:hypothetical protein